MDQQLKLISWDGELESPIQEFFFNVAAAVIISGMRLCIGRMCLLADGTGFIA